MTNKNKKKIHNRKKSSKKIEEIDLSNISLADIFNYLADSNTNKPRKGGKNWKLKSVDENEWIFVEPHELHPVFDDFDRGCVLLDQGSVSKAEKLLRNVISKAPLHIDALHHLAIILDGTGKSEEARKLWNKGVEIGRNAFPKSFESGDHLEWGWLENRPFLRCLDGLATSTRQDGEIVKARGLYEELLSFNPNDNLGIREQLIEIYLEQNDLKKALELCRKYPDDFLVGLSYGYPLVLFKMGKLKQATNALKKVVKTSPKVAKELLKKSHKKPQSKVPDGFISVGGWDEAYSYYLIYGKFWDENALDWLRKAIRKSSK